MPQSRAGEGMLCTVVYAAAADFRARKFRFVHQDHVVTLLGKRARRERTGRPSADHRNIPVPIRGVVECQRSVHAPFAFE